MSQRRGPLAMEFKTPWARDDSILYRTIFLDARGGEFPRRRTLSELTFSTLYNQEPLPVPKLAHATPTIGAS